VTKAAGTNANTLTLFEHEYMSGFNWTDGALTALQLINE
jgi:hypothetical protein